MCVCVLECTYVHAAIMYASLLHTFSSGLLAYNDAELHSV